MDVFLWWSSCDESFGGRLSVDAFVEMEVLLIDMVYINTAFPTSLVFWSKTARPRSLTRYGHTYGRI